MKTLRTIIKGEFKVIMVLLFMVTCALPRTVFSRIFEYNALVQLLRVRDST